jgi:ribosomal protein S18 acetylase RimI-like enzyme
MLQANLLLAPVAAPARRTIRLFIFELNRENESQMLNLHPPFRRATPADARAIAELIDVAGKGIPSLLWEDEAAEGETPLDVGTRLIGRSGYSLSFENAVVGEDGTRITSLLLGCVDNTDATDLADAPEIVHPLIRLHRHAPRRWHVHALAVRPEYRRHELGTRLLRITDALAFDDGLTETSLTVAENNEGARRLYDREGYREVAREPVVPHSRLNVTGNWLLMTRPVVANF